jgi:hypothetical protein
MVIIYFLVLAAFFTVGTESKNSYLEEHRCSHKKEFRFLQNPNIESTALKEVPNFKNDRMQDLI